MAGIVVAAAVLVEARIAAIDVAVDVLVGCGGGDRCRRVAGSPCGNYRLEVRSVVSQQRRSQAVERCIEKEPAIRCLPQQRRLRPLYCGRFGQS